MIASTIRQFRPEDLPRLMEIHEKYYKEEFVFPQIDQFHLFAVVEDENGDIITAGGIRPIAEVIAMTNKDKSVRDRFEALSQLMVQQIHYGHTLGYNSIHCFVQDPKWVKILKDSGFEFIKGDGLVLNLAR